MPELRVIWWDSPCWELDIIFCTLQLTPDTKLGHVGLKTYTKACQNDLYKMMQNVLK